MLTLLTQTTLAILNDISCSEPSSRSLPQTLFSHSLSELLDKLEQGELITLFAGKERGQLISYQLARPLSEISLLDVLEATGEHLNCNHVASDEMYQRYGLVARKLGVINQLTRSYLSDIKVVDL